MMMVITGHKDGRISRPRTNKTDGNANPLVGKTNICAAGGLQKNSGGSQAKKKNSLPPHDELSGRLARIVSARRQHAWRLALIGRAAEHEHRAVREVEHPQRAVVSSVKMTWVSDKTPDETFDVSFTPEGRTGAGTLRYKRSLTVGYSVTSAFPCN